MDTLNIMYIIMAGVGILFLGLSIFGGEADSDLSLDIGDPDFDISDAHVGTDAPSMFSMRTISVFLLAFGLGGMIGNHNDLGMAGQLIAGFISGLLVSGLFLLLMRGMYSMQGTSNVTPSTLVGEDGYVNIPTTSTGVAQVKVATHNGSLDFTCKEINGKTLKQNDKVTIKEVNGSMLTVEKQ